jgi:hypothetical protein
MPSEGLTCSRRNTEQAGKGRSSVRINDYVELEIGLKICRRMLRYSLNLSLQEWS